MIMKLIHAEVRVMEILVAISLVAAIVICLLPVALAFNHYRDTAEEAPEKSRKAGMLRDAFVAHTR